ncbi:UNVERIFIED_CONTAM: hypothetical protein NCL1_33358 [Trichonephila clavipes]
MPRRRIRNQYEHLSEFYRARIIGLKEIGWANWRVTLYMGKSDADNSSCRREWMEKYKTLGAYLLWYVLVTVFLRHPQHKYCRII